MDEGQRRYAAFLSYSHKDAAAARALHRRLESYRIPRRLVGTASERGSVPARLTPIFRDREELPAAADLSETVRAALAVSDALVILCSPAAAASPWVAKEIETFRALHPARPIIAAILDGEPADSFPPPLCAGGVEPLAADLRPGRDGRRLGFLKLVAGLSGVGLDSLVQRDAQRRLRRVTAVTGVALAAVVAMAILTTIALQARREAQRQRAEAEGLVEFMLTDLRDRLKGVGRLDVLRAVNQRVLAHYRRVDLRHLPVDALERRARTLHAMGEDDKTLGNLAQAEAEFSEAARTTSALLDAAPNDPERIFAQAQSEFWIGAADMKRKRYPQARQSFRRYRQLATRLVSIAPENWKWRAELAYAEGNLCSVELDSRGSPSEALRSCTASLREMERAAANSTAPDVKIAVPNRYGWLADAYHAGGNGTRARQLRRRQEELLLGLLDGDRENSDLLESLGTNQYTTGELEIEAGDCRGAWFHLSRAARIFDDLTRKDPANADWRSRQERVRKDWVLWTNACHGTPGLRQLTTRRTRAIHTFPRAGENKWRPQTTL